MSIRIALAGNPNSGKTTLFNALTGANQFVGNWPGVTVEKKEGRLKGYKDVVVTDLPGIYSLSPYTLEEVVARDYLIDEKPDAIINIVDGTNLERNLYLTTQLAELGIPLVVAVNMMDEVEKAGDKIDFENLARELGCPALGISALRGTDVEDAAALAVELARKGEPMVPRHVFSGVVEHALAHIEEAAEGRVEPARQRWYAVKLFERDARVLEKLGLSDELRAHIEADVKGCEAELGDDAESIVTNERYDYIASIIQRCIKKSGRGRLSVSDRIDRVVTNRYLALPIFALVMFVVYFVSVTTVGAWATDWTNDVLFGDIITNAAGSFLVSVNAAPWMQSLIVEGIKRRKTPRAARLSRPSASNPKPERRLTHALVHIGELFDDTLKPCAAGGCDARRRPPRQKEKERQVRFLRLLLRLPRGGVLPQTLTDTIYCGSFDGEGARGSASSSF
ncbi:MAG: Ferrous iron transport protein B [Firmicutes bacterium ADurb.Bin248]|nr:MAG: Ferrous iron transport protein B [Firmicutes bacterium ADurb.Bin248]